MNGQRRLLAAIHAKIDQIKKLETELETLNRQLESSFAIEMGRRIQAARKHAGLTQQALADAVGLSRGSIANIERGDQAPPPSRLARIAGALGVDVASLMPSAGGVT